MTQNDALREQIAKLLEWQDAHATFEAAVEGLPPELRGRTVDPAAPVQRAAFILGDADVRVIVTSRIRRR
mgnify:CR=1 FL=1